MLLLVCIVLCSEVLFNLRIYVTGIYMDYDVWLLSMSAQYSWSHKGSCKIFMLLKFVGIKIILCIYLLQLILTCNPNVCYFLILCLTQLM